MVKMAKWRRHRVEFKRQVVERMRTCESIGALARELKIQRKLLYTWKYQFEGRPEPWHANLGIAAEGRREKPLRDQIAKLRSALVEKSAGERFFQNCLAQNQGRTPAEHCDWRLGIYGAIRSWTQEQGALSVERMRQPASVSRASSYRRLVETVLDEAEMATRAVIQEVVLAHHRRYGYRRVTMDCIAGVCSSITSVCHESCEKGTFLAGYGIARTKIRPTEAI